MSSSEAEVTDSECLAARLADLIISHHQAKERILELEETVAKLEETGKRGNGEKPNALHRPNSAPLLNQPFKKDELRRITEWNRELVETVNSLRKTMLKMETDTRVQLILLGDEVEHLRTEKEELRDENESLKERVADDVLRQRQTNRVEMAFEKAKIAARVRAAGLRRLECMEAMLMESHDDLYFVQRFDAAKLPVREVTFVFHFVGNVTYPLAGGEEFTMNVYRKLLFSTARLHGGYHLCSAHHLEVFAFQSATAALNFSKECHVGVTNIAWPTRTSDIPFFAPVIDNDEMLYNGPRMHTCLYTCNPGSEVDAVSGRPIYYGPEVREAVLTALHGSSIGEIMANDEWGALFCREANIASDANATIRSEVPDVRAKLGPSWSVVAANPTVPELRYSILPVSLEGRRGLPPYLLFPSERFPRSTVNPAALLPEVLRPIKGVTRLATGTATETWVESFTRHAGGATSGDAAHEDGEREENRTHGADLLALYSLRRERTNITHLYKKLEVVCAIHEQYAMEAEDRYAMRSRTIDTDENMFVCTMDMGEEMMWRSISRYPTDDPDARRARRDELHSATLTSGQRHEGIHVNGDGVSIFTYAFRRPEQVLRFAAEVYTAVEQCALATSSANANDKARALVRGGIAIGKLQPFDTAQRHKKVTENSEENGDSGGCFDDSATGALPCRGPVVALSGDLCDLARPGEIVATAAAVQAYYASKTNLASMDYNILRLGSRILGGTALVELCSVLPKSHAPRRQWLMATEQSSSPVNASPQQAIPSSPTSPSPSSPWASSVLPRRGVRAALRLHDPLIPRDEVRRLLSRQQCLLERAEAAAMVAHDTAWDLNPRQRLRLAWPLSSAFHAQRGVELGFLFCDTAGGASVSSDLRGDVLSHYNFVVQRSILRGDGLVVKTDGVSAYIAVFADPHAALETAMAVQRGLLEAEWPTRLLAAEETLYVRSARTGIRLFHGVRCASVVHCSAEYRCARSGVGAEFPVDVFGPAVELAAALGRLARGGEALVTQPALDAIRATLHGALLLRQLALRPAEAASALGVAAASCVPRGLSERLELLAPPAVRPPSPPAPTPPAAAPRSPPARRRSASWWQEGGTGELPAARRALWAAPCAADGGSTPPAALLQAVEDITGQLRREAAAVLDSSPCREGFLTAGRDLLAGFAAAYKQLDEAAAKAEAAREVAAQQTADALQAIAAGRRTPGTGDGHKRILSRSASPTNALPDPYRGVLLTIDAAIKGALQRTARALAGGSQVTKVNKTAAKPPAKRAARKLK